MTSRVNNPYPYQPWELQEVYDALYAELGPKIEALSIRFDQLDRNEAANSRALQGVEKRVKTLDGTIASLDGMIVHQLASSTDTRPQIEALQGKIAHLADSQIRDLTMRLDRLEVTVAALPAVLKELSKRVDALRSSLDVEGRSWQEKLGKLSACIKAIPKSPDPASLQSPAKAQVDAVRKQLKEMGDRFTLLEVWKEQNESIMTKLKDSGGATERRLSAIEGLLAKLRPEQSAPTAEALDGEVHKRETPPGDLEPGRLLPVDLVAVQQAPPTSQRKELDANEELLLKYLGGVSSVPAGCDLKEYSIKSNTEIVRSAEQIREEFKSFWLDRQAELLRPLLAPARMMKILSGHPLEVTLENRMSPAQVLKEYLVWLQKERKSYLLFSVPCGDEQRWLTLIGDPKSSDGKNMEKHWNNLALQFTQAARAEDNI